MDNDNVSQVMDATNEIASKVAFRAWRDCVLERMRVLIVAGITTGALVAGFVSRMAMMLLRVTSPDRVNGLQSDDDFTIGKFTLGGTYSLMVLGAFVGLIGFATYRLLKPWLIGPHWFRRLTIAIGAGAVAGSMLVHADGIDFTVLKPMWLAIGLFVALPALFAVTLAAAVDSVSRPRIVDCAWCVALAVARLDSCLLPTHGAVHRYGARAGWHLGDGARRRHCNRDSEGALAAQCRARGVVVDSGARACLATERRTSPCLSRLTRRPMSRAIVVGVDWLAGAEHSASHMPPDIHR